MKIETYKVIYVMEAGEQLMDKIRRECSYWGDGDKNICMTFEEAITNKELHKNICMTFEEAITNKELRKALRPYKGGCDVIVSE